MLLIQRDNHPQVPTSSAVAALHNSNLDPATSLIKNLVNVPVQDVKHRDAVLGKSALTSIRDDIQRMTLPSWIGRVPANLGSSSHGSLSADQWRTACTVNLVASLINLWGSNAEGTRTRQMLDNFMDLVTAIKLAHMRVLTPARIAEYHTRMEAYLKGIVELYPDVAILPYHHMSLHLTSFLRNFGPVHGWRCFPFERYNYVLQKTNTNRKFGECHAKLNPF